MEHARTAALAALAGALVLSAPGAQADTIKVRVTIENLAPINGNFLTPFWVGFHDGTFDIYDSGVAASAALERLAEDGDTGPISGAFLGSGAGVVDGTIAGPGGPIAPGDVATLVFTLDSDALTSGYFSFASMVIPSNDAFIANGNPLAFDLFDAAGNFLGVDVFVMGSEVLDAGTEVNDEIPEHTAFFGQTVPNTGIDEFGVVGLHGGFLPVGSGGILDDPMFANADFTRSGYPIAQIRLSLVPIPGALLLLCSGLLAALGFTRRR